jgi:hypothetical protein
MKRVILQLNVKLTGNEAVPLHATGALGGEEV